jgi:hypothetical protein
MHVEAALVILLQEALDERGRVFRLQLSSLWNIGT